MSRVGRYSRFPITGAEPSSPTGLSPAPVRRSSTLRLTLTHPSEPGATGSIGIVQPRIDSARTLLTPTRFGLCPVRSPLLRASSLFLGVLRCFSSPGSLPLRGDRPSRRPGCPIRRSRDRRLPAPPPRISSRGHVLHRRPAPRHPPCAHHSGRTCVPPIQPASFPAGTSRHAGTVIASTTVDVLVAFFGQDLPKNGLFLTYPPGWSQAGRCPSSLQLSRCSDRRWSRGGSNPEPPPCKGGALPVELRPRRNGPVGAPGLEPGTSALSGPRSNQLSYAPAAVLPAVLVARAPTRRPKMEESRSPWVQPAPKRGSAKVRGIRRAQKAQGGNDTTPVRSRMDRRHCPVAKRSCKQEAKLRGSVPEPMRSMPTGLTWGALQKAGTTP
jgi:hypothetical protein